MFYDLVISSLYPSTTMRDVDSRRMIPQAWKSSDNGDGTQQSEPVLLRIA